MLLIAAETELLAGGAGVCLMLVLAIGAGAGVLFRRTERPDEDLTRGAERLARDLEAKDRQETRDQRDEARGDLVNLANLPERERREELARRARERLRNRRGDS